VGITVFGATLLALTLHQGAYIAEIFRAGIEAVSRSLFGQYLSPVKDTSIAVVIGYVELVRQGQAVIDRVGDSATSHIAVDVLYFVICYPLSLRVRHMGRKAVTA
jgi:polar amino acid transport system permease protein